jgi:hypothetical protein
MTPLQSQQDLQNQCGGYPLVFDMRGRAVCGNPANLASGYYLYSDAAIAAMDAAGTNMCPQGIRPGMMRIKGLPATETTPEGYISTCGGRVYQEDMPDLHIIDWEYRILTDAVLAIAILMLLGGITLKLLR